MQLGMIGLGRMGGNMVRRLLRAGHACVVHDAVPALADALAREGVSVVGLDSLRYFWKRRTLAETTRDVARILAHYRAAWRRDEVLLVGYSRGADVVPLLAGSLPADERARLALVAMLGPGTFAELEVHAVDLFTSRKRADTIPTEDAVRATAGAVRMICFHGEEERDSLCPRLAGLPWVTDRVHAGGHRLGSGEETARLAREILSALPAAAGAPGHSPSPRIR